MDKTIPNNGFIKKELLLLRPFMKEPWREFTVSNVKLLTKTKSHHFAFNALKKFTALGITRETRMGNTNTYSVDTEEAAGYLSLIEREELSMRKDLPLASLKKIASRLKSPFYTLLIGGSYAEHQQKPTSDLDIAIIIPNSDEKKKYLTALKEGELTIPEVHGYVFTQSEFQEMLTNDEFNYGKELARKHIIIKGAEAYYSILFEAMRHGFKG